MGDGLADIEPLEPRETIPSEIGGAIGMGFGRLGTSKDEREAENA